MSPIFEKLKQQLTQELPGAQAHAKVSVPGRDLVAKNIKPNPRISAVLILLYEEEGEIKFPLILRPQYDGVHGGQMALPGGGREEQDGDLHDTALRECFEEVGFTVPKEQILGELTTFYIPPSNSMVTPIVAYSKEKPTYSIDPHEVDRVIETDLSFLLDPTNFGSKPVTVAKGLKMDAKAYLVDKQTVWGATAMILSELLDVYSETI